MLNETTVETPMAVAPGYRLRRPSAWSPILRAGLAWSKVFMR